MDNDNLRGDDAEYQLSRAEALLGGTLALMTGHAQAGGDTERALMVRKILVNLAQLSTHACISPQFGLMLCNLQTHWRRLQSHESSARVFPDDRAWHAAPGRLQ